MLFASAEADYMATHQRFYFVDCYSSFYLDLIGSDNKILWRVAKNFVILNSVYRTGGVNKILEVFMILIINQNLKII